MSEPSHDIANSDIDFWVWSSDDENGPLGHLHVSKGGLDWYSGKSSLNRHKLTWEAFQKLVEGNVSATAAPKAKRKRA
jgi:hypothetical protein